MVNHGGATVLLIMSLLVAVALFGADARPTMLNDMRGQGFVTTQATVTAPAVAATPAAFHEAEPKCEDKECEDPPPKCKDRDHCEDPPKCEGKECEDQPPKCEGKECEHQPPKCEGKECEHQPPKCEGKECEDPPPKCEECAEPPPACDTCEHPPPEPKKELTCKKVHGVKEGETCESVAQCAGLGQEDFLGYNPNLDCCKLFVGQWVCLETGCDECDG